MKEICTFETGIAAFAAILSLITLVWTIVSYVRQQRATSLFNNLAAIIQVEAQLKDIPSALKFHGVDPGDLEKCGITSQEFAYLLANFTASGIYYKVYEPCETGPFNPKTDEYRYRMCVADATRKAWPLLRRFIDVGNYRARIEATIKAYEEVKPPEPKNL